MRGQGCQRRASSTPLLLRLQAVGESWSTTADAAARRVGFDIRVVNLNHETPGGKRPFLCLLPYHLGMVAVRMVTRVVNPTSPRRVGSHVATPRVRRNP